MLTESEGGFLMPAGLTPEGLVYSENYADTMNREVLPWLKSQEKALTVRGAGNRPIAAFRYDAADPRGTAVILHGFTECAAKFSELTCSLLHNRWSVLTCDQRGHGASWRDERITDLSLTHVDSFQEYVDDLRALCDQALKQMPRPWVIFAHSMGGAVTCAFLEDHPGVFEKAVLCAPMIAPNRGGMSLTLGKLLCRGAKLIGKGRERIFISKPFDGPEAFETSNATGRERFDWYDSLRVSTEKYHNNGPTWSWTLEAFSVTRRLLAPGKPEGVTIPVMLYSAETDGSVLPEPQAEIVSRLPKGQRKTVPGSKHEIYRSPDDVLFPWWREILDFLGTPAQA